MFIKVVQHQSLISEAWVWSPPRPAADSRQGPDPGSPPCSPPAAPPQPPTIPARLCLQAASRGPTLKCFPAADRQPDPDTQGSRPRGRAPSAGGAGGRAGPDLLIALFPTQSLSPARSPPRSSQRQKVVTENLPEDRVSYQQLPQLRESQR